MATSKQVWFIKKLLSDSNAKVEEVSSSVTEQEIKKSFKCFYEGVVYEWIETAKNTAKPFYNGADFRVDGKLITVPETSLLIDRLKK